MTNKLKQYRKEKNLTQKEVATYLGLQCEDRLSHWEKGISYPSVSNFLKLCTLYEVDPRSIYVDSEIII